MTPPSSSETVLDSSAPSDWDTFVHSASGSSFCHLADWGTVLKESMGLDPLYLSVREGGATRGVLPLIRMPRLGFGHALVSMPFLNYGGPLGPSSVRSALANRAVEEARSMGARKLEIRNRFPQGPDDGNLARGRGKVTVVLPLPEDPDTLFKDGFKAKLRSQIRRPMKEGMQTRFGPSEQDAFYQVFARNMRDLGTPVLPRGFFREVARVFPDEVEFGAVYYQDQAVAAGCGFRFGGEFEMTWASSLREFNRQAPNMLLYWAFMERCIANGVGAFNFGRCTPGGGTHRFKRQWGGEDEPLHWLQWPEGATSEDPEKGVFQTAVQVWQKVPLPLANAVGPLLARRIPTF